MKTLHQRWFGAALALCTLAACSRNRDERAGPALASDAPIPLEFPASTRLRLGDPTVQKQLALNAADEPLGFEVTWNNISGGPYTLEAFRANALDAGSCAATPPIHATFTGLDVRIVAVQTYENPRSRLATAPGVALTSIQELRGKRIAYSPGQAQGALVLRVLREAGLSTSDVQLVELTSYEFRDALVSGQVDVAPLSSTNLLRYLREHGARGASSIAHGVTDSISVLLVQKAVLDDGHKAAALREYVERRTLAQLWAFQNRDAWVEAYYVGDQGLSAEEGRFVHDTGGRPGYPGDWAPIVSFVQDTVDLLADASGRPAFDARTLFDFRFQSIGAEVASAAYAQR